MGYVVRADDDRAYLWLERECSDDLCCQRRRLGARGRHTDQSHGALSLIGQTCRQVGTERLIRGTGPIACGGRVA